MAGNLDEPSPAYFAYIDAKAEFDCNPSWTLAKKAAHAWGHFVDDYIARLKGDTSAPAVDSPSQPTCEAE